MENSGLMQLITNMALTIEVITKASEGCVKMKRLPLAAGPESPSPYYCPVPFALDQ